MKFTLPLILGFFLLPLVTSAQEPSANTITLFPAQVRLEPVPAGETTLQTLTFQNETVETHTFEVEILDYRGLDEETFEFVPLGSTPDSLEGMIDVTPTRFELASGEAQQLLVRIRPEERRPAGHYKGVVFVGPVHITGKDSTLQIAGRVGSLFGVVVTNPLPDAQGPTITDQLQRHKGWTIAGGAALALFLLGIVAALRHSRRSKRRQTY